ncbi:hypothetical protein ISS08_00240 [Candidatus Pacearchaeota archaeon]|nr:hypothetical protein [Candidatus Pacearchaeota archaeon]
MTREFSDRLSRLVKGYEEINMPKTSTNYGLGEKTLLIINVEGNGVKGGRMPYHLRQGIVAGKCVTKKRKGETSPSECNAIRLKLTHEGTENSGLVERSIEKRETYETYLYDNIVKAYLVK